MKHGRLIIEGDRPGSSFRNDGGWNMSVDEVLLRSAATSGQTTLRFYGWQPATLSLGYFQPAHERSLHTASQDCPMLRRASGGGAIVHDCELTYSFATPDGNRFGPTEQLYFDFHETLVETLAELGAPAQLHRKDEGLSDSAFLCFQRRAVGDVTSSSQKVCGSAQRRWKGGLLQHGSILLAQSEKAPELPGLRELTQLECDPTELVGKWLPNLLRRLKTDFVPGQLADKELQSVRAVGQAKFSNDQWTRRR